MGFDILKKRCLALSIFCQQSIENPCKRFGEYAIPSGDVLAL